MTTDPLQQQKDVEFHAAAVAAWFNTSLERDKSLFALAAGGLALLVTLLTTVGVAGAALLVLNIVAIVAFLVCLMVVLVIFQRNRTHIEQVLVGRLEPDPILAALDYTAMASFFSGALLTAIIGISVAITSYSSKEKAMATENKQIQTQDLEKRSFNELGKLQQTSQGNQGQGTGPAPAPAPAPAQNSSASSSASGNKP